MVEVKAVIGKNFGDEGKGQTVDRLCRGKNALVLRHNGGAQSGHTVEEGNFRFVFHQLGSGSFQGCPTYWCRTFLPDLLKLGEEMTDAGHAGMNIQTVYAHPDCACVTVYDVLLNSLKEQLRGDERHGSCGMGIFEAVLRSREQPFALYLRDFERMDTSRVTDRLRQIRDHYAIPRLRELQDKYPHPFSLPENTNWVELIRDDNVLYNSAGIMCENYRRYVSLADWPHITEQYDTLIFENGQGLMLDWDNEEYAPHLTASHTGLKNVTELLNEPGANLMPGSYSLEIIYVSRSYVTRHGAGRLDHECAKESINPNMMDRTNICNPWQDHLRYGRHPSEETFFQYIRKDLEWLKQLPPHQKYSVALYLTHLDETHGKVLFSNGDMAFEKFRQFCREESHCISTVLAMPYDSSHEKSAPSDTT